MTDHDEFNQSMPPNNPPGRAEGFPVDEENQHSEQPVGDELGQRSEENMSLTGDPDGELPVDSQVKEAARTGGQTVERESVDDDEAVENIIQQTRDFDDLTLAEALDQIWRYPNATLPSLMSVLFTPRYQPLPVNAPQVAAAPPAIQAGGASDDETASRKNRFQDVAQKVRSDRRVVQLGLYLTAFLIAWIGSDILVNVPRRTETTALNRGAPYLFLGFLVWLAADIYGNLPGLRHWWKQQDILSRIQLGFRVVPLLLIVNALAIFVRSFDVPEELVFQIVLVGIQFLIVGAFLWLLVDGIAWGIRRAYKNAPERFPPWLQERMPQPTQSEEEMPGIISRMPWWMRIHPLRIFLMMIGLSFSIVAFFGSTGNSIANRVFFVVPVFYVWIASIVIWGYVLSPLDWNPLKWFKAWLNRLRGFDVRKYALILGVLAIILLVGAIFRFAQLDTLPPEMTDDHVEKLLDSQRVLDGQHMIFFANNGGREPIQMYLMAAFVQFTGREMNHDSLKLLKAIESLISLPFFFWLGVEIIGKENRRLGLIVGVLLSALIAVSYWHVAVSRQALRITLMPLVTALLMIYLGRGMRYNQRADFIKAGIILGFGLYVYQAVRMLPVVVVVGVGMAMWMTARTWQVRLKYMVNLSALVIISFVIFVPMFRYSVEHPEEFWRRTAGRLLGDDIIYETTDEGQIVERRATIPERLTAFNDNMPVIMSNIRNALLMYNWKGDVAWISGVPNYPAMDPITGSLLILGLAAWGVRIVRRRDSVDALMPVMVFLLLLPSALSIAYPIENPSATRTMGSLPPAYIIATFPLALIFSKITTIWKGRRVWLTGTVVVVMFVGGAYAANSRLYFNDYPDTYILSTYPYSDAGEKLRAFANSDGSYGNAFMIAYPHWWSHRAVGIEAGRVDWPNGIVSLDDLPRFLRDAFQRTGEYRLDPDKDLVFFVSPDDEESLLQLQVWFPEGRAQEVTTYHPDDSYVWYRVPWLGLDEFVNFLVENETVSE